MTSRYCIRGLAAGVRVACSLVRPEGCGTSGCEDNSSPDPAGGSLASAASPPVWRDRMTFLYVSPDRRRAEWACEDCGSSGWEENNSPATAIEHANKAAAAHPCTAGRTVTKDGLTYCAEPHPADPDRAWNCACPRGNLAAQRPEMADEIRAVICEPLGLGEKDLPGYGERRRDHCSACCGPHPGGGLCAYCAELRALQPPAHSRWRCDCRTCARIRGARALAGYMALVTLIAVALAAFAYMVIM